VEDRPPLGDGPAPDPDAVARAVRLSRAVGLAAAALATTAATAMPALRRRLARRGTAPTRAAGLSEVVRSQRIERRRPPSASVRVGS
jgi:hypothetical protein